MELSKIEAFDLWIKERPDTETQISAQILLHRVTSKLNYTFRSLKAELYHAIQERDELQNTIEQQQEENPLQWEKWLGDDKIEDPSNSVTTTMKNLPPPISIFQYYKAYKPLILTRSSLPDIKNEIEISEELFQMLWVKANSEAKDLLVFMWILKDLTTHKGVVEITTANHNFYLTRFCVTTLTHIARHHEEFYNNIENRKSLPQIQPYEPEIIKEIQDLSNSKFPQFLTALDGLATEDTRLLHKASHQDHNLIRKFPDSFPQAFHRIQLQGYITRALEDRKNTLEQRLITTPHARTLLYLPQYDPGSMRVPKRS